MLSAAKSKPIKEWPQILNTCCNASVLFKFSGKRENIKLFIQFVLGWPLQQLQYLNAHVTLRKYF